ncbi:MAG: HEPN domain-containing protein [Firmicutes bacterium]|nr:HEPN domain-containing protein [Bacillota bacterium]
MDKTKTLSTYRLQKAKKDLETAKINFDHGYLAQSVNRSYYAAFHALRALLAYDTFDSKKHSSILGFFNKNYIASGKINKEYYKIIARAFDIRTKSDYQDFYVVAKNDAKKQLGDVETFIKMIENYILLYKHF